MSVLVGCAFKTGRKLFVVESSFRDKILEGEGVEFCWSEKLWDQITLCYSADRRLLDFDTFFVELDRQRKNESKGIDLVCCKT